jgi:hypothetical protein
MTAEVFNKLLEDRWLKMRIVLRAKAGEYATDADRLHNFKTAGAEFGLAPEEVCKGYMLKHWMSLRDMIAGERPITKEMIDEKIGDAVCYLVLLEAILTEKHSA